MASETNEITGIMERQLLLFDLSGEVYGIDIDDVSLTKAAAGDPYRANEIRNISQPLKAKYFTGSGDKFWIIDRMQTKVTFKKHDLLREPCESNFDLILCRNVVIYFSEEAKRKLNERFFNSFKTYGVLLIGGTETMLDDNSIGFGRLYPCFYRRPAVSTVSKERVQLAALPVEF